MNKYRAIFYFICLGVLSLAPMVPYIPALKYEERIATKESINPPFIQSSNAWADSVFQTLSLDEKIGQLFMVAAYSNKDVAHEKEIENLIKNQGIGGLIFMQGTPDKQIDLTNKYQALSKVPLMLSIDGEWGLPMRLKNTFLFPKQMTMGAVPYDSLVYQMGAEMAKHCKRMGIHVNFAPVIDVNNNPRNPIINYRSFGENRENVAKKGIAYMNGMQDNGILACGKHFPGHGDTESDSHLSLPIIKHSQDRLDSIELYPFKQLINEGLGSLMVAHLYIPALDSTKNRATTLSPKVVQELLKDSLKFKGLVFTDALNMKGVSAYYKPGIVDVNALLAGNDVLLFSEDVPTAINEIKKAIENREISIEEIEKRCKKILYAKAWLQTNKKPISKQNLATDLNPASSDKINRLLYENAITLIKNKGNLIPLTHLDTCKIASVVIGDTKENSFQKNLSLYTKVTHFSLAKNASTAEITELITNIKTYNTLIISVHDTRMNKDYGISDATIKTIQKLATKKEVILHLPTNPYVLERLGNTDNFSSILISYEDNAYTQDLVPQAIFGGISIQGILPVSGSKEFPSKTSIQTNKIRLAYKQPMDVGMNPNTLNKIDAIATKAIQDHVFPGCQILVAHKGNVVYNKSFGHHTYDKKQTVSNTDIYDIASVTKIAVSTLIMMKMHEEGIVRLDATLGEYLPDVVEGTPYKNVRIKDMLAHQAGFEPWIPFYTSTISNGELNTRIYSKTATSFYDTPVAENIYIFKNYRKSILQRIVDTDLSKEKKYKYSDLGYYFLQEIIERKTNLTLDKVIDSIYYNSLGLQYATYNPLDKFNRNQITPTEDDKFFRKQVIHGYVHDQGAALMGGVGGHAGLFSNANDLAIMMQMLLNKGVYGGKNYLNDTTITKFTTANHTNNGNRRGYGFDKPTLSLKGGPTCELVSLESYGHSGFTGTRVWVDPKKELVYIFLSNRVYPDAENWKIVKQDIRTRIEELIYQSFESI